jgi:hypothetical protein
LPSALSATCWQREQEGWRRQRYQTGEADLPCTSRFKHYTDWLDERDYHGIDWVPHDRQGARAGRHHGPETRIENMMSLGRNPRLIPNHKLMDGIHAGRQTILLAWFDAERCAKAILLTTLGTGYVIAFHGVDALPSR